MSLTNPNNAARPTFSSRRTSGGRARNLISLTPLIDVVFILLLFFMLASNFLDLNAIEMDAPAAGTSSASSRGALLIEVRIDGVRFAGRYMPLDDLTELVQEKLEGHPERRVFIQPGKGVKLQATVRVLDQLSSAGIVRLSLIPGPGTRPLD